MDPSIAYVWNMSFALIPCNPPKGDMVNFYKHPKGDTTLSSALGGPDYDAQALLSIGTSATIDPLKTYIDDFSAKNDLISVASAGNSGPRYPSYYPGAWPEVISVGDSQYQKNAEAGSAPESNLGEVMVPGAWYNETVNGTPWNIRGTSFAAPGVSVLMAAYLTNQKSSNCDFRTLMNRNFDNKPFLTLASDPSVAHCH